MDLSLKNKTSLVCGSSQGIGLALAKELAFLGADCILLARNEKTLETAVHSLSNSPGQKHRYYVADFSKPAELKVVVNKIMVQHTIHILVNNTGGPKAGSILEATDTDFLNAFNQHIINNQALVQAVVPGMKKEKFGRIINIISTSVKIPLKNLGVSNTIRGAVASWAKTLANELGQFNITVNNILPGFTDTERLKSLVEQNALKAQKDEKEIVRQMLEEIPAGRFGTAEEVAAVGAFLATPAAAYVNGVSIQVDGGRTGSI
ncbi:MAG TPA: SDR family oxidoreductase [Flavisolibacter sp.]|nr:SDR family oxidoreductase [Flavisolibacter sp.]